MKKLSFFILALSLTVACNSDDEDNNDQPQQQQAPSAQTPAVGNVDGVFVALNVAATIDVPVFGPTSVIQGMPFATITDNSSAGNVSCEGEQLDRNGGAYTYMLGIGNTEGVSYDNAVD
jgi:hypothetical protein